jgi:predicted kinase
MLILMAGLPGTGKSTLARELAARTSGVILGKDEIRKALFPPGEIDYSTAQDDFCQQVMLETAAYLLGNNPERYVFLDGRTFSRRYQIDQVLKTAADLRQSWRIIECISSGETARQRLEEQARTGEHPAGNRDYALYLKVKIQFEPITLPKAVIDMEQPLEACVDRALRALREPSETDTPVRPLS